MTTPLIPFAAGDDLTAAQMNEIQPLSVIKPTDQSVTSSTVMVNDNALSLPLAVANATYLLLAYLDYEGGTQGSSDLKFGWTVPSGTTMRYQGIAIATSSGGVLLATYTQASTPAAGTTGAGNLWGLNLAGTVVVGSTTGTLQFRWAQNGSNGTPTIVHAQSYLALVRVS